jgi:hypothetical protein
MHLSKNCEIFRLRLPLVFVERTFCWKNVFVVVNYVIKVRQCWLFQVTYYWDTFYKILQFTVLAQVHYILYTAFAIYLCNDHCYNLGTYR